MHVSLDRKGKLYDQIARAIRLEILEGNLVAGSKLPPARALASAFGVSRPSVYRAYDLLRAEESRLSKGSPAFSLRT